MRVAQTSGTILFGIAANHAMTPDRGMAGLDDPESTSFAYCGPDYWRSPEMMRRFGGP